MLSIESLTLQQSSRSIGEVWKVDNPRSLSLNIQAGSQDQLKKLLDLAISELERVFAGKNLTWSHPEGSVVNSEMSGTMGSFQLDYMLGSQELVERRNQLLQDGYQLNETSAFGLEDYDVYEHVETGDKKRLYPKTAELKDHGDNPFM